MKLALLYPAYLPDLYYIACLMQADRAVLLDTEPFSRKARVHRGKIRTPEGFQWLNIPVPTEDKKKPVGQVRMDHSENWVEKHLRALEFNYRNSIYFDFYEPEIRDDLHAAKETEFLVDFIEYFRRRLFTYLYLDLKTERAGELSEYDPDPDRFAENLGAEAIFQEKDSRYFQRQARRRAEPEFHHPEYRQHFGNFVPGLCVLDVLFQYGPSSYEVIDELVRRQT